MAGTPAKPPNEIIEIITAAGYLVMHTIAVGEQL